MLKKVILIIFIGLLFIGAIFALSYNFLIEKNNDVNEENNNGIDDVTDNNEDEDIKDNDEENDVKEEEIKEDEITIKARAIVEDSINEAKLQMGSLYNGDSTISYDYVKTDRVEYDKLTNNQKQIYDTLLPKILNYEDFVFSKSAGDDVENASVVLWAISQDNPKTTFYLKTEYIYGELYLDEIKSVYILPGTEDLATKDEVKEAMNVFNKSVELIVAGIDENWSTQNKYIYLAAVASYQVDDYENIDFRPVYSGYNTVMGGNAQCLGYSIGFKILCESANLYCEMVDGSSRGIAHAWNLIKIEDGTYHTEVTWADELDIPFGYTWLRNIFMTQDEVLFDHDIHDGTVATGKPKI